MCFIVTSFSCKNVLLTYSLRTSAWNWSGFSKWLHVSLMDSYDDDWWIMIYVFLVYMYWQMLLTSFPWVCRKIDRLRVWGAENLVREFNEMTGSTFGGSESGVILVGSGDSGGINLVFKRILIDGHKNILFLTIVTHKILVITSITKALELVFLDFFPGQFLDLQWSGSRGGSGGFRVGNKGGFSRFKRDNMLCFLPKYWSCLSFMTLVNWVQESLSQISSPY